MLFHGGEIHHLIGQLALLDLTVRAFDEAILVHARMGGERVDQADIRAFRRLNRADTAIVCRVNVANLEACALTGETARAKCRKTALMGDFRQRVGLVHELRQLRRAKEFTHRSHNRLRIDQVVRHDRVDIDRGHALLDGALHAHQTDAIVVLHQLTDRADAAVAEVVDIVDFALAVLEVEDDLHDADNVLAAQGAHAVFSRLIVAERHIQAHVHLHTANRGKVVAFAIEEELVEQCVSRFLRRRLARPHDAVDVGQRLETRLVLVRLQRVAQPRATVGAVDVEDFDRLLPLLAKLCNELLSQDVASFTKNLAGFAVDDIAAEELTLESRGWNEKLVRTALNDPLGSERCDLAIRRRHNLAGLRVNKIIAWLLSLPRFRAEAHDPAALVQPVDRTGVEEVDDLVCVIAERIQHRRRRQFALAVDADVQNVLGVKLEVEPGPAIWNDPGREEKLAGRMGLAAIMVEEDARRAVHLGHNHTLGAVHDERTLVGHQRNIAEIDLLLLDLFDRFRARVLVNIEDNQLQPHLERRCVGQVTLHTLLHIELRRLEFVRNVFKCCALIEVDDRENAFEDTAKTIIGALGERRMHLQKLLIGGALHFDEVWHVDGFGNTTEGFADTFFFRERKSHLLFRFLPPTPARSMRTRWRLAT